MMRLFLSGRRQEARSWSLVGRLAWRLAAVMTAAILLAAVTVAWRTVMTLHDMDDYALQGQVHFVLASLPATRGDTGPLSLADEVTQRFQSSDGDNVFVVLDRNRQIRATSDRAQALEALPDLPTPLVQGFFRIVLLPQHPDGMVGYAEPAGQDWVIVLQGREQTHVLVRSLTTHFLEGAIWSLGPIGLLTVLVSVATLRRGLRSVTRASAAAAAVKPSEPGVRLPVTGLPVEVVPLVTAVNDALSRLEQTIATQRSFMAQAAHGLRTPLAVLTARLDIMPDTPGSEALQHDVDRMSRLVSQLLRMARLESLPLETGETVDLRTVAADAIADLAPLGLRHGVELALTGDCPVLIQGNPAALLLAVTNLIENAIGYAPCGSTIDVTVTAPGRIAVLDRGPGVPPEDQARILQPFERGPKAREGGAGLGLAIVSQIVRAHGGRVQVAERPGGGTVFTLNLESERQA